MKNLFKLVSLFSALFVLSGCTAKGNVNNNNNDNNGDDDDTEEVDYNKSDYNPVGEDEGYIAYKSDKYSGCSTDMGKVFGFSNASTFQNSTLRYYMKQYFGLSEATLSTIDNTYDSTFFSTHVLYTGYVDLPKTCTVEFMKIWNDEEMKEGVGSNWNNHDDPEKDVRFMSFYYTYDTLAEYQVKNQQDLVVTTWFYAVELEDGETGAEHLKKYPYEYSKSSGGYPYLERRYHFIVKDQLSKTSTEN